ncbi:hypothetical protein AM228_25475 [Planktothricoides sp. SR001]|nr:hypothetical protein AM228_25475 [Planktothricoides sp. SR001]
MHRKEERGCIGKRKILYSLFSILYSLFSLLPTGGNSKPIGGERKVQLIIFTYLLLKPGLKRELNQ